MGVVSLVDVGGVIPNLALMKLSTHHKNAGHQVVLGWGGDLVYISSVFSWDQRRVQMYKEYRHDAVIGGSGVDVLTTLPAEVDDAYPDYSLYKDHYPKWRGVGIGFLSRGCLRNCPFCIVPAKEGKPRVVATLDDLVNPEWGQYWKRPFVVVLDNNFLAISKWANAVLDEMVGKQYDVCFSQGLDIRLVTPEIASKLAHVRYWNLKHTNTQLTFAFDSAEVEPAFRRGVQYLIDAGIKPYRLQSFVLVGFGSTLDDDIRRVNVIRAFGMDPFVMVYRDPVTGATNDRVLRHFARWVNRRLYKVCAWDSYRDYAKVKGQLKMEMNTNDC